MGSFSRPSLMLGFFGLILLLGGIISEAKGDVLYYDFFVQESNFTRMCNTKSMLTVNGSFPGPTITVHKNQTFYVNVHNQATYGVTIHWHGVKQPRNPWSDGPENITQCPIQPGTNFTYQVILSTEEGTLWWHAHNDWTRATVHGAIVILPNNNTYHKLNSPDGQQTIVLASWFNGDPREIALGNLENGTDLNTASNGYTINGQPGDLYQCSNDSTFTMNVTYGKTYMLRIVNAVLNDEQFFGIANHTMTVVAQDAAYVKPFVTNYIMITPGQTIDVLVKANQTPGYYYMASTPFSDGGSNIPFSNTTTTAILKYIGNNVTRPSDMPLPTLPSVANDTAVTNFTNRIRSLDSYGHPFDLPKKINQHLVIAIAVNFLSCEDASCGVGTYLAIGASLNNVSFEAQNVSILQAYYNNLTNVYGTDFPNDPLTAYNYTGDTSDVYTAYGTKVKVLNYMDGVEIVFQGTSLLSAENHPMHVHGFSYYLVGRGTGNWNNVTDPPNYNLNDPPLINTVGVPKNGWVAIRFVANNPGVWFIHCHFDKHALWGMATVLIVKNGNTTATSIRAPPSGMPTCSA